MGRVLVLVEGQTEERFVKDTLGPYLLQRQIHLIPTLVRTKVVKDGPNFKGGVSTFGKIEKDLRNLLAGCSDGLVTTMLDYYQLPSDTPGMATRPSGTPYQRVEHVEAAIHAAMGHPRNFSPFLLLHEFEGLLFSSPAEIARVVARDLAAPLVAAREGVASPEEINDRPEHSPSKRIQEVYPEYRKVLHGPTAAGRIGVDGIREQCPHFHAWLSSIERYGSAT